jgi:FixJ family two-component response regulator
MDPGKRRLVAIVHDDPGALGRLVRTLGCEADTYPSGEALLATLIVSPPGDVLLDLHLPGLRGPELIAALGRRFVGARVVAMTGLDSPVACDASWRLERRPT